MDISAESVEAKSAMRPPYDWRKFSFVWSIHVLALVGVICWGMGVIAVSWRSVALALVWFGVSSTAITAGYHRLFSHRAYKALPPLELLYLIMGTAAFQGPVLPWAAQHRDHHTFVDQPNDPYNIRLGFWFAHMGWVVRRTCPNFSRVIDLMKNPLVRFQFRFYYPLAFLMSFALPCVIGASWHGALGALLVVGFVRLTLQWHMTFCVNSVAHYWGSQKYSTRHSARGSWWLSFLTWGEMDHNYHHSFPDDFRTGTRWWDFDPGKWWVWGCSRVGLASELRIVSPEKIQRAIDRIAVQ